MASPAACPGARLFATGGLGKPDAQSRTAVTLQEAIFPLFFKDLNSSDVLQVGLVSGLGFLHTVTTRDSKRGGKGTGSSGTLLMAWGLRLCWEAPPVWSPSPSRGRCPQTVPIPPHQKTGHWWLWGCRDQPSSWPLAPGALPLLEATLLPGLGTTSSPPGTPLPRADPTAQRGHAHPNAGLDFNLHYPL